MTGLDLDQPVGRSRRGATAAQNYHAAVALHRHGRLREAEELYRVVLDVNESDFDCLHNLGLLRAQDGRLDDAVDLLRASARQDPHSVEVHNNLANVLALLQRHDEAVAGFRIAIALKPDFAEAHNNLANALSSPWAAESRVSMAFQLQRADVPPFDNPLIEPLAVPPFEARIKLIARQLYRYRHMYELDPELARMASESHVEAALAGAVDDAGAFAARPLGRDPGDPSHRGRLGRNEPCPCGSGKRYKHCHGSFG